ncbi:unnamed protein product, partial [Pylaiella littoralis]
MPPATVHGDALKFVAFSSLVKIEFWTELATKKLDTYRLNDDAQPPVSTFWYGFGAPAGVRQGGGPTREFLFFRPIYGFYGSGHNTRAPCRLTLLGEPSFESTENEETQRSAGQGARFEECRAMGYVKNVNTKEAFKELDKPAALAALAREMWADAVESDRAVAEPERLLRFLLLTFADLKKSTFLHWFAFPTLGSQDLFRLRSSGPARASSVLSGPADTSLVVKGLAGLWARSVEGTGRPGCPPFFVVVKAPRAGTGGAAAAEAAGAEGDDGEAAAAAAATAAISAGLRVLSLLEFDGERREGGGGGGREAAGGEGGDGGPVFGFIDPCSESGGMPGWPLRNFLVLLSARWGLKRASVLCFREHVPRASLSAAGGKPSVVEVAGGFGSPHGAGARESTGGNGPNLDRSVVLDIDLSAAPSASTTKGGGGLEAAKTAWLPARVGSLGWEPNAAGRPGPRMSDLSGVLDPARLAENSVRLNIKLMRWRALPELDVELLAQTKCLLLGAGTLGCAVARCLMGWGVQHISLVDNGRVAYSNPVRQSLFTFEDCKGGGKFKAKAAAAALSAVFPGAKSAGHVLTIPMPGHPLTSPAEAAGAKRDAKTLEALVSSHDVVFVLTDSRESRWLPTLLAAKHDRICVNAALGLDSFLVVRHGGAPSRNDGGGGGGEGGGEGSTDGSRQADTTTEEGSKPPPDLDANATAATTTTTTTTTAAAATASPAAAAPAAAAETAAVNSSSRLGCYFCTDVVAPENSSLNRTLDQQCTVTRPGLAPMAAATAVEMTVGLLHHPLRQRAPASDSAGRAKGLGAAQAAVAAEEGQEGNPLGALPHQVRGFIASFTTVTPSALAFDRCTACSAPVVAAHESRGWEFVEKACNSPQVLEEVSGLEEMRKGLDALDVDLDWGVEDEEGGQEGGWEDDRNNDAEA